MAKRSGTLRRRTNGVELWTCIFIAAYLLFTGFDGFSNISQSKFVGFCVLMAPLLLLGVICLIREPRGKKARRLTPAQICALVFWAFTLLSAALSPAGGKAWYNGSAHEAAVTVSLYVLLFLIVSRWGAVSERTFKLLFWSLAVFCVISYLQLLKANPLRLYPSGYTFYSPDTKGRYGTHLGTIGNVDLISAFLALTIPMLLLHTRGQKPRQAWPCWLLAAACLGILFWIKVLCGVVGLVLGAALCLAVLCPDAWRKRILLAYAVLGVAALAVLYFFDLPVGFFHELHEMLHGHFEDSYGTGRIYIWRQMLERVPDRLFVGVGPDMARFSGLSPFVRYDELGNIALDARGNQITATITDAHCFPLQILYCQGLPALLSWLGVVGMTLYHWVRRRADRAVAILGGGLICFLCAMLFCLSSVIIMPFFWLTMALIEAKANQEPTH